MCTVTIVPAPGGFRLACNRDERRDRPGALAPRVHAAGPVQSIFPVDPQGGGTWIGVNTAGIAAVLLNRTERTQSRVASGHRFSRGSIVPPILGCTSLQDALRASRKVRASSYLPFRLVLVAGTMDPSLPPRAGRAGAWPPPSTSARSATTDRRSLAEGGSGAGADGWLPPSVERDITCGVVSSDGHRLSFRVVRLHRPLLFTSSSLGDDVVAMPRWRLFEQYVLTRESAGAWLEGQREFHRHRWPDRGEISVVMSRAEARTVSRTTVDVSDSFVTLDYHPLGAASTARVIAAGRAA